MRRREFITLLGSTAAMWPRLARAQRQGRIPKVGVLWHAANIDEETPYYQSLVEGFGNLGYVDGQNITLEHRFPNEVPELFGTMAAELVKCDVLVGAGAAAPHLKKATKTIPIVFMFGFETGVKPQRVADQRPPSEPGSEVSRSPRAWGLAERLHDGERRNFVVPYKGRAPGRTKPR